MNAVIPMSAVILGKIEQLVFSVVYANIPLERLLNVHVCSGALAVCEGAVDTYMWYHKVYEIDYSLSICRFISHRYLLYSHLAIFEMLD